MYQARHNRINDLINNKLVSIHSDATIIKDSILNPSNFEQSYPGSFTTRECRPDIALIDKENKKAYIVEISVPFDAHINLTYKEKFEKYVLLSIEINNLGFYTQIIVLIVGSLWTMS